MIEIAGTIHRSFIFPANRADAFKFYSNLEHTLNYLTHISILQSFADLQYRVVYHSSELGIYRVRIFCDIGADLDRDAWAIRIHPLEGITPIRNKAGLYSLSAQGQYTSESLFAEEGNQTRIDYRLQLSASLPVPHGVRFMPSAVLDNIAQSIMNWRIQEIVEGFIERSITIFSRETNDQGENRDSIS